MKDNAYIALIIVLAVVALLLLPFATIWALNTIFPVLAIPYTFWSWLAMLVLQTSFGRAVIQSKLNKE